MINDIVETGKTFSHIDNDDSEFLEMFPDIQTTSVTGSDIVYTSFIHKKEKYLLKVMNLLDKSELKKVKQFCECIDIKNDEIDIQRTIAENKKDYIALFLTIMGYVTEDNFNLIEKSFQKVFVS